MIRMLGRVNRHRNVSLQADLFRDPESHPAARARLVQVFANAGQFVRFLVRQLRRTYASR
jgi:hypothetical protein